METIIDKRLNWIQTKLFKPEYEIRSGEYLLGKLKYKNLFSAFAIAETSYGHWILKRKGFLKRSIITDKDGLNYEIAVLRFDNLSGLFLNLNNALIKFLDGTEFLWKRADIPSLAYDWEYVWMATTGEYIIKFDKFYSNSLNFLKLNCLEQQKGDIFITTDSFSSDEISLLIMAGMYLVVNDRWSHRGG